MNFIRNKTSSLLTDTELLDAYRQSSDLEILGQLYARYMTLVYGVCLKYFKDEEKSKDAVMQIFEELVKKLKIHQVQNFKSWLHVTTKNYCLMLLRKESKYQISSIDDEIMEMEDFEHPIVIEDIKEEKLSIMEKCLETLTPEQKISVELFYLKEKCYKDISSITGFELLKVKSYIQNGKRNLKICIEKNSSE
ncbi:RNA polymerase sigma factor [Pedobacter flavus]|uniref:Sigma-70 family RNA polymerase sigma factor n=1 Tax=Pedobacter flavus TaxID=3113906 RepID=A0ABU7GZ11_9SPHI|nr:sigma-70 family RNA polymerase sigma factor [Pedobacter sp. VNH31]MEE1884259.1 sigma-70 family RNA polymerase sigma factor [Pedobacter sp. VNH31]